MCRARPRRWDRLARAGSGWAPSSPGDLPTRAAIPGVSGERSPDSHPNREALELPQEFFLYVGSIIERKNLLAICKALLQLKGKMDVPLVVVGNGKKYKDKPGSAISRREV